MRQEGREHIVICVVLPIDIAFPRWLDFHDEFLSRQCRAVQQQIFRYRDPVQRRYTNISNQIMLFKQSSAQRPNAKPYTVLFPRHTLTTVETDIILVRIDMPHKCVLCLFNNGNVGIHIKHTCLYLYSISFIFISIDNLSNLVGVITKSIQLQIDIFQ